MVVVSPGRVLLVVVVVVVVVELVVVVAPGANVVDATGTDGHDRLAVVGLRTAGVLFPPGNVVRGAEVAVVSCGAMVVSAWGGSVSNETSASVSTGATAGGSLCIHASSLSTTAPMPLFRAHDATFCCSGSLGCART